MPPRCVSFRPSPPWYSPRPSLGTHSYIVREPELMFFDTDGQLFTLLLWPVFSCSILVTFVAGHWPRGCDGQVALVVDATLSSSSPSFALVVFNTSCFATPARYILLTLGQRPKQQTHLYPLTLNLALTLGLVPLIMLCNAAPQTRTTRVRIAPDWAFCTLNAILSVSNGYLGNICMIHGPKRLKFPVERETASILINSMIVIGIATGSALSLLLRQAL